MSGYGKGGKGLGKGGAKRHRKVARYNVQGITKPVIRRLARCGGVKRIPGMNKKEISTAHHGNIQGITSGGINEIWPTIPISEWITTVTQLLQSYESMRLKNKFTRTKQTHQAESVGSPN
ncbi:hypothetical protein niasHT_006143 [Heterodera trifolii]|uniref:Histone H4 n=1 Tax=Heterodera trifolii TaxID=157864 RepID=A0ABD2M2A1_9BILA